MQICPQCGYKDRFNWPLVLWVIGFFVLYVVWMLGDYRPQEFRWVGIGAFLVFNVGTVWMALRKKQPTVPKQKG